MNIFKLYSSDAWKVDCFLGIRPSFGSLFVMKYLFFSQLVDGRLYKMPSPGTVVLNGYYL